MSNEYDYQVVEAATPTHLARRVHHLRYVKGWQPIGGVAVLPSPGFGIPPTFYQAMIYPDALVRVNPDPDDGLKLRIVPGADQGQAG